MKDTFDLDDEHEKKLSEELKVDIKQFAQLLKELPFDKVWLLIVRERIRESQFVRTTSEHRWSANVERITNAAQVPVARTVHEDPQAHSNDTAMDIPVVHHRQVPTLQTI